MNKDEIKRLGYQVIDILAEELDNPDKRPPLPPSDKQGIVEKFFCEDLPEEGTSPEDLLNVIQQHVIPFSYNTSHSGVFSSVSPSSLTFPSLIESLVAGLRLYAFNSSMSPASNQIEVTVIKWLGQFIGYSESAAGYFASGGTSANLMGLLTARVAQLGTTVNEQGINGHQPLTAYASEYVHECMDQSMRMMGIGNNQLRKIPVDEHFKIRLGLLEQAIQKDLQEGYKPFCIIGVAGVTATGSVDDLNALADLAEKYKLWFHIDGAYGAFAASLSSKQSLFAGIDRANSIVCDPHKWLNLPLGAGVILVKDWQLLKNTFAMNIDCMGSMNGREEHNQWQHGFELSRQDRALKVWTAIKHRGASQYRDMLNDHIQLTEYLANKIQQSPFLELIIVPTLSVCCFRYKDKDNTLTEENLEAINKDIEVYMEKIGKSVLGSAQIYNKTVLRACIVSHRITKDSVDKLIDNVIEAGHYCQQNQQLSSTTIDASIV